MKALLDHIFPIVGWPLTVYSDNGSHFTGSLISDMWKDHGVMHFASAISHPQLVGLSERYVQMFMGRIRLACLSSGSSQYWSREIRMRYLLSTHVVFEFTDTLRPSVRRTDSP